jgi:hypothetical protein
VTVLVADDGTVVTLGEHESVGARLPLWFRKQHDLVAYSPGRKVLCDRDLRGFLTVAELEKTGAKWRFWPEDPWVLPDRVEVTTHWGDLVTVDLATGDVPRGPGRFAHLRGLMAGDLAGLVRVEYEGLSAQGHVRCTWMKEQSICETVDPAWKATPLPGRVMPRAELRGKLAASEALIAAVEPEPTIHVAVGQEAGKWTIVESRWLAGPAAPDATPGEAPAGKAQGVQLVRLIFERGGKETIYDLEVESQRRHHPDLMPALRTLLGAFQFDTGAVPPRP